MIVVVPRRSPTPKSGSVHEVSESGVRGTAVDVLVTRQTLNDSQRQGGALLVQDPISYHNGILI